MTRFAPFPRDFYIPKGSVKIADRNSDGVVYVYRSAKDRPATMAFHGEAVKPDWHHSFANEATREHKIRAHFEGRQRAASWPAEHRAERKQPHGFEVGHILYASWGYEQTNIDFYQVTRIIGAHTVEVREVSQIAADTGNEPWMTGKCLPKPDGFTGEPLRRRVNGRSKTVRIDKVRTAFLWDGRPINWTGYA
ncbi:hypothetical protein CN233_28930 [Sinorhizobium meliloti]|uniref:hypothetical protein n=1 Tax=Rhizobium meliloti TaxID=382 RepID=UPI000FDC160F|nr:hypothetical protein [Sinorhizobium meliloti]RVG23693.1 hypothetical protein CN233_28930 [Sinorhizobium meliloti]